jgi:hypothetical protein
MSFGLDNLAGWLYNLTLMKLIMKNFKPTVLLFSLLCLTLFAGAAGNDTTGVVKTLDAKLHYIGSDAISIDYYTSKDISFLAPGVEVTHKRSTEDFTKIKLKDIKWMVHGDSYYIMIPDNPKKLKEFNPMRVAAVNKDYVLFGGGEAVEGSEFAAMNVYDSQMNAVKYVWVHYKGKKAKKEGAEAIEMVKQYFPTCKSLISDMQLNVDNDYLLMKGTKPTICDGSYKDIMDFLENYKDYRTK